MLYHLHSLNSLQRLHMPLPLQYSQGMKQQLWQHNLHSMVCLVRSSDIRRMYLRDHKPL